MEVELELLRSTSQRAAIQAEESLHELNTKLNAAELELQTVRAEKESEQAATAKSLERVVLLESQIARTAEEKLSQNENATILKAGEAELIKEKRELLLVLERAESDKVALQESLDSLRTNYNSLQNSHSTLEANQLDSNSISRSSLVKIETLSASITSLESDNQFLNSELSTIKSEFTSYRTSKHAELSKLQSSLEIKTVEATSSSSSLQKLRKVHDNLITRHEDLNSSNAIIKEQLAVSTSQFTAEMSSLQRLVKMLEAREAERIKTLAGIESAVEEERISKVQREAELEEELSLERQRFDLLEVKFIQLQQAFEDTIQSNPAQQDSPGPVTPNGFTLSPSAQMAVRLQKTGKSYAEVYTEYIRMQEELSNERAETKRLGECLTQILTDIEERAPLLKEQRMEYDRISTEATQLAARLAQTLTDRDDQALQLENYQLNLDRLSQDNTILVAQLRDLGRQVRALARAIAKKEVEGIESRSGNDDADEEEEEIRKRAEESNDTDAVVSAHLVTFSTINELQVQNQKLLRITREMGAQMESGEEAILAKRKGDENSAVIEAHQLILRLKEEVESQRTKMETFIRERDMFRRMLAQRGELPGTGAMVAIGNGESTEGEGRILAQVQANFDAYKSEIAVDSERLRNDLSQALKDVNVARTDLAKTKAQTEFLSERFRLLNETYELQSGEILEMSKRTISLQQMMAKQDDSSHKMTEDLIALKSTSDQLRHENTNYKTEREVRKGVENRLVEENAALSKERSHLADLMRNLQNMQNELERAGTDSRRRLEEQVSRLETQSVELRNQLNQESDAARQLGLRREFEGKNYQDRIDKLTSDYSTTRESLIAAKTSQEHLERRVADLVSQVTTREEKLAVYEGRTTSDSTDPNLTAEQQLEIEVVALKNELRVLQTKLDQANINVQQFQSISTTQGESLSELHTTYDEYKNSTDASIAEKETEINSLRERLHSLTSEITTANTENSELHRQLESERTNFEKQRKLLEDDVIHVRLAETVAKDAQLAAQDDLRRQAQVARDAHEKYERELVAHAEDVKRLTEIKDELLGLRTVIGGLETTAEVAKANLSGSEESWARQKSILDQEITDLRKRCDDLNTQNVVLHEHLETFGTQAAKIQAQDATDTTDSSTTLSESTSTESTTQLREVIRYLRREKEIVDLQLEFGKQEAARLRQQLEFANRNLEESRQALVEERQRAGESTVSSTQHAELLERIHTAQLLRESNSTLRDENERNLKKVANLDTKLKLAAAELDPLRESVQTLQAVVESKEAHLKLVEEDNERWKNRNQQILAKYERIDPEELQVLKDETEKFKNLLAESEAKNSVGGEALAESVKLADSMRSNWTTSTERFKNLQTQARVTRGEHGELTKEVAELKAKLESAATGSPETTSNAASQIELKAEKDRLLAQSTSLAAEKQELETQLRQEISAREAAIATLESDKAIYAAEKETSRVYLETREKRMAQLLVDNKRMITEAKEHAIAVTSLQKNFEEKNSEAIEAAVQVKLALIVPTVPLSEVTINETVRERVAIAEIALTATREVAIAKAVEDATAQLRIDLVAVQAQLAVAIASPGSTPSETTTTFETARQSMLEEFEKVKVTLAAEAKARELEITARLTAEITKATNSNSKSTPAEIDALVKAQLATLEADRLVAQQKMVEAAVTKALETRTAEHQVELVNAKVNAEKEASLKNKMLSLQLSKSQKQLAEAKASASPIASTSTLPPLVKTSPAPPTAPATRGGSGIRGGLPARGGRGGRGGGLAARVGIPATSPVASIRGAAGGASMLSLKGTASPGPVRVAVGTGGVLNRVLASNAAANSALASTPPKRAREEEESDATKRLKQQDPAP